MLIIRRSIYTASGIVTLCKWPSSMQVEQELLDLHTGHCASSWSPTRSEEHCRVVSNKNYINKSENK